MKEFFTEFAWVCFWLMLGCVWTLSTPSIAQVMKSGDQYQVRYNKQNYLLVPCHQTQCK